MNELRNNAVSEVAIDEASAGQRLDNFLARTLKGVPKSHLYRIVRSGEVRVNGRRAGPDARLAEGDRGAHPADPDRPARDARPRWRRGRPRPASGSLCCTRTTT